MKLFLKKNCTQTELIERMLTFFQIEAEIKYFESDKALKKGSMVNLAPLQRFPALCQDNTCLNDLQSIIKYLCSLEQKDLIGKTILDQCCLDQYCSLLVTLDQQCQVYETIKEDNERQELLMQKLNENWQLLENRLQYNSFLAGNYMTYADIVLTLVMKQFEQIYKSHKFTNIKRVIKFVENSGLVNQLK